MVKRELESQKIQIFGAMWCSDCVRAKRFLDEHKLAYNWHDVTVDATAMAYVQRINNGMKSIPTILFMDGAILVEPSNRQLARKLGITE